MTKSDTIRTLKSLGEHVAQQADYLANNIKGRRVSHTMTTLKKLINFVCQINKHMKSDQVYARQFEKMLFQAQGGPLEVTVQKDLIYIQGVVRIDALKEFFIVNEPPGFDAIEVLGPSK